MQKIYLLTATIHNNIDDSRKGGGEASAIGRLQRKKTEPVKNIELQCCVTSVLAHIDICFLFL